MAGDSAWLSLNQIADLFQRDKSVISKHIKNIFDEEELDPFRTVAKFATVQIEGARSVAREIEFYRLEVILAVGYRVKSARGAQFRQRATSPCFMHTASEERLRQRIGALPRLHVVGGFAAIRVSCRTPARSALCTAFERPSGVRCQNTRALSQSQEFSEFNTPSSHAAPAAGSAPHAGIAT